MASSGSSTRYYEDLQREQSLWDHTLSCLDNCRTTELSLGNFKGLCDQFLHYFFKEYPHYMNAVLFTAHNDTILTRAAYENPILFERLLNLDSLFGLDVNVIGDGTLPVIWAAHKFTVNEATMRCLHRTSDLALRSLHEPMEFLKFQNLDNSNSCRFFKAFLARAHDDCSAIVISPCKEIDDIFKLSFAHSELQSHLLEIQNSIRMVQKRQQYYKDNILQTLENGLQGHSLAHIVPLLRCILEWSWCFYDD